MPYYPRKRGTTKKPSMAKKSGYRKKRTVYRKKSTFAKRVKSVLYKESESKAVQFFQDNVPLSDYATGAYLGSPNSMLMSPLTPDSFITPIALGNASNQRIGNKIRLSKVTLRGMLNPRTYQTANSSESPSNNAPEPFLVKMWIGYQKDSAYNEIDAALPNFFQEGNTSAAPTGTLMDTFRRINTDKYVIVATRTFKVGPQQITLTQNATVSANNQNYSNNEFKFCQMFSFDVTKYCPKIIKYNDTNNQPNARGLYWFLEAVNITGEKFVTGRFPAEVSYEIDIQYKDI